MSSAEKSLLPIGSLNQLAVLAQILECEGFLRRVLIASKNKTALKKKKKGRPEPHIHASFHISQNLISYPHLHFQGKVLSKAEVYFLQPF